MKTFPALAAMLAATAALADGPPLKKWAPGHYFEVKDGGDGQKALKRALDTPKSAGALIRVQWRQIETRPGVFDMSIIADSLALARAAGKKLGIALEDKGFNVEDEDEARCVPDDMLTDARYSGGQEVTSQHSGQFACNPKRAVPAVGERWAALLKAVGQRFDADPTLVMVQNTESALNSSGLSQPDYGAALERQAKAMAAAFPTTPWALSLNWSLMNPKLQVKLIDTIASLGGGMTHPDTVPPSGNGNPFDAYFSTYAGRIVSAPLVELTFLAGGRGHLFRDGTDCGGHPCTWTDVYDYAVNRLHAHYIFWPRMGWGEDRYIWERDLLPVLEAKKWAINTACPSNIRCQSR